MATFTGNPNTNDNFTGSDTDDDLFLFTVANLTSGDTLNGRGGFDTLRLTSAGALAANALAGVTAIERIDLFNGGNSVTLTNTMVASATGQKVEVIGKAGNDIVNASALTAANFVDITAGGGVDTLTGGAGNDTFRFAAAALTNADIVAGGGGSDRIVLSTGGTVAASAFNNVTGIERIYLSSVGNSITLLNPMVGSATGAQVHVLGGIGNDTIIASSVGGGNRVYLRGGDGKDSLTGGAGSNDTILGEDGDDSVAYDTNDLLVDGGAGVDTLTSLAGGYFDLAAADQTRLSAATNDFGVTRNFENVVLTGGTPGTLLGSAGFNRLIGGDGNDVIDGRGGADILGGGAGDDAITYNAQAAGIVGGAHDNGGGGDRLVLTGAATVDLRNTADQVSGGGVASGFESVDASTSTQSVTITGGNVAITPGGFAGNLTGGSAGDIIRAGAASAVILGGGGADTLRGGAAGDRFVYYAGEFVAGETVDGLGGYDSLDVFSTMSFLGNGITNIEQVTAYDGVTVTLSASNAERISAVSGAYENGTTETFIVELTSGQTANLGNFGIVGVGQGSDAGDALRIVGTTGNETVTLSGSVLSFYGRNGNDSVTISQYSNYGTGSIISGDGGNDRIDYRPGAVTIDGGTGFDTLVVRQAATIDLSNTTDQVAGPGATRNFEHVDASASTEAVTISAGATGSRLTGGSAGDSITGGAGNDYIDGGAGDDILNGGGGNDIIVLRTDDADDFNGGDGFDTLLVLTEQTLILPDSFGDTSIEHINASGATGAQILWAFGNVSIHATGSAFADTYNVSHGTINAGDGADRIAISAAAGNLAANGQAGADVFEFQGAPAATVTLDFVSGQDRLEFANNLFAGMSASTFLTEQTVTNGQAVAYTADLLRFGFLTTQAQVQSYMTTNGTVDHAFAIDGAGHLYFIDDGAITYLADGVSSAAMSDFLFT